MKKENVLVVALIVLAVGAVVIHHYKKAPEQPAQQSAKPSVEKPVEPLVEAPAMPAEKPQATKNGISWQTYESGLLTAKQTNKNIFLYFHAQWCTYCTQLKARTFSDKKVQSYLNDHFVSIAVDADKNQNIARQYQVTGLPTMWFLKPDGSKISNLPGYVEADQLRTILEYIQTKSYETMSFRDFVNK